MPTHASCDLACNPFTAPLLSSTLQAGLCLARSWTTRVPNTVQTQLLIVYVFKPGNPSLDPTERGCYYTDIYTSDVHILRAVMESAALFSWSVCSWTMQLMTARDIC